MIKKIVVSDGKWWQLFSFVYWKFLQLKQECYQLKPPLANARPKHFSKHHHYVCSTDQKPSVILDSFFSTMPMHQSSSTGFLHPNTPESPLLPPGPEPLPHAILSYLVFLLLFFAFFLSTFLTHYKHLTLKRKKEKKNYLKVFHHIFKNLNSFLQLTSF